MRLPVCLILGLLVASGLCAQPLRYTITVGPQLQTVTVQARFPMAVRSLRARAAAAGDLLALSACGSERENLAPLQATGGARLRLSRAVYCLTYRARLRPVERGGFVGQGAVMSTPRQWLWLPPLRGERSVAVTLELPDGMSASVPWQPRGAGYEFGPSPSSGDGLTLFGNFPQARLEVPGGALRVALASSNSNDADWRTWQRWLQAAATEVAAVGGQFPNGNVQVLLVPNASNGQGSPVPFGHVVRDMGELVRFFVEPGRQLADYLGDWTAGHEFAHLLLPYVKDKWVSEGFASYYQNLLMARSGAYSERELWQRMTRSFEQAAAIAQPPRLEDLGQDEFWRVRMLVYWSGAALALMADVQLRQLSDGSESLDSVLGRLQRCCLPAARSYNAQEFFALLDTLSPQPLFTQLHAATARSPGMPPVAQTFARLGIAGHGSRVRLVDAPLVELRRALGRPSVH